MSFLSQPYTTALPSPRRYGDRYEVERLGTVAAGEGWDDHRCWTGAMLNIQELRKAEVGHLRTIHRRISGSVTLQCSVTVFGQQGTEAETWRLGVLRPTYPQARHPQADFYHLPEYVRLRSPLLEAHILVDHLCLTERGTPVRGICRNGTLARIISRLPVTAHRAKA